MSILSRIEKLKERIRKYKKYIKELEELYRRTEKYYRKIEDKIQIPESYYDISNVGKWKGDLKDKAQEKKDRIVSNLGDDQALTAQFMSDILTTIDNLYQLIQECEDEIADLEAQLCEPSQPQE